MLLEPMIVSRLNPCIIHLSINGAAEEYIVAAGRDDFAFRHEKFKNIDASLGCECIL